MWSIFDQEDYRAAFFVCIITPPICILVTIMRFLPTTRSNRKIGLEDWFALAALGPYLTYTVMILWIVISMQGKSVFEAGTLPPATVIAIYKVGYVMNTMYPLNQNFAKLSLLLFYHRIFSISRPFRIPLWIIGIIQMCWFLSTWLIRWFMCTPIARVWDTTLPGHCIDSNMLLAVEEVVNSLIDFAMVALAIWMVRSLKMSSQTRWKLSILFALGGLSGVIGFIKIAQAYGDVGSNVLNAVWAEVQMAASIVCCSAPLCRTIIPEIPLLRSIWSRTFGGGSSGRNSDKAGEPGSGGFLHRSLRTWGQGSRSMRRLREDPDAFLTETSLTKTWGGGTTDNGDAWVPLESRGSEAHVETGATSYQSHCPYMQQKRDDAPAYPSPATIHVQRTVEVV